MSRNILNPAFQGLLATQFFGAANDNILKVVLTFMVIDGVWAGQLGPGGQGIVSLLFTMPFILLSGFAGQVADRHSKQLVTLWVKISEIPIAVLAMIGFWIGNLWLTLFSLVAITIQSTFFGPAKYGMIPEIVDETQLSRANGTINMMTNLAVIAGTLVAGTISDRYDPKPPGNKPSVEKVVVASESEAPIIKPVANLTAEASSAQDTSNFGGTNGVGLDQAANESLPAASQQMSGDEGANKHGLLWLPGAVILAVAIVGLVAALLIPRLGVGDRSVVYTLNPFRVYYQSILEMSKTRLLMVMMAWGYFYMLAGLALLILPEYTTVLGVTRENAAVLMGVMGIAIGLGCASAGFLSGDQIRPQLIPIGAAGIIVFFCLLGQRPSTNMPADASMLDVVKTWESVFVLGAGFFAGFYIVPLQALLQKLSPDGERGRFLGTANAVSFSFFAVASLIYYAIRPMFGETTPQHIFFVSAALMAAGAAFFLFKLRGTGILIPKSST